MPEVKINVPVGSRVNVRSGPGFWRALAYEFAMAATEARHEREANRVYANRFSVGDLVERRVSHSRCHATVTHVGRAGPNEHIVVSFSGGGRSSELAARWAKATYLSRRRCTCVGCRGWNALNWRERTRRRHELIER